MDTEKIELYIQLWNLGKVVCDGLNALAKNPKNEQVLVDTHAGFQALRPYLSSDVSDAILHIYSGADITPKDLRRIGQLLLNNISETISKALVDSLQDRPFIERFEAEKLFSLWDEIPHMSKEAYQWIFYLCTGTSLSMPLEAYQYSLRMFEEQPKILSVDPHPSYVYRPSKQRIFECCPICGGEGTPYFRAFSYHMEHFEYPHLPAKLWMKCGGCGNLYTWKYPEELLRTSEPGKMICPDPARVLTAVEDTDAGILSIWSDILCQLSSYSDGKELLEVGIGKGEFLAVALEMGYQPDAVELVPESAQKAADMLGIPIWCGDFLNYRPNKTYSIITMGDVIEHVTDPKKALKNANRLLKEDGVLWLSTPNFESSFSKMRKFNDAMWLEPYHITYFCRESLEALAKKCGFQLREYHVSHRYNGSMEVIFTKDKQNRGSSNDESNVG